MCLRTGKKEESVCPGPGPFIKDNVEISVKKQLNYIVGNGRVKTVKPWLGDLFAFAYDFLMEKVVFPRKLGSDMGEHLRILDHQVQLISGKRVLELATGSGSSVNFLGKDSHYTGTDISPGLLKMAVKRFRESEFRDAEFYVTGADDLPFEDSVFEGCLCILALNFFNNLEVVVSEVKRVLERGGVFICCVPVPERINNGSKIRGTLYSENELKNIFISDDFSFESIPDKNGSILYFKAVVDK